MRRGEVLGLRWSCVDLKAGRLQVNQSLTIVRDELVWASPKTTRFSRAFASAAKRAGVRTIRLHDLRHTWATLALQAGIHPKVVSERLGHATTGITLDVYSHVQPEMDALAASAVADLFA